MDMEGELGMETKCNEHGRRIGYGNGNNDGNNNQLLMTSNQVSVNEDGLPSIACCDIQC